MSIIIIAVPLAGAPETPERCYLRGAAFRTKRDANNSNSILMIVILVIIIIVHIIVILTST